jgi:hypothetical protein
MTVQDAETPGRQDQQSGAWKEDTHDVYSKFPFLTSETGGERAYQQRRSEDSNEDENGYYQGQDSSYGSGNLIGLCLPTTPEERRIYRNERRRKRAFPKKILQEIGDAEGRVKSIGSIRLQAEIMRKDP